MSRGVRPSVREECSVLEVGVRESWLVWTWPIIPAANCVASDMEAACSSVWKKRDARTWIRRFRRRYAVGRPRCWKKSYTVKCGRRTGSQYKPGQRAVERLRGRRRRSTLGSEAWTEKTSHKPTVEQEEKVQRLIADRTPDQFT